MHFKKRSGLAKEDVVGKHFSFMKVNISRFEGKHFPL
jgi:hypothetical protein